MNSKQRITPRNQLGCGKWVWCGEPLQGGKSWDPLATPVTDVWQAPNLRLLMPSMNTAVQVPCGGLANFMVSPQVEKEATVRRFEK